MTWPLLLGWPNVSPWQNALVLVKQVCACVSAKVEIFLCVLIVEKQFLEANDCYMISLFRQNLIGLGRGWGIGRTSLIEVTGKLIANEASSSNVLEPLHIGLLTSALSHAGREKLNEVGAFVCASGEHR